MKLTIFGATGLVGRNLCDVIEKYYRGHFSIVDTPSKASVDLLDKKIVEAYLANFKPDVVINLAGKVGGILANKKSGADFYYENILMNAVLYEECARRNVSQLINLGAGCGYPLTAAEPLSEDSMFDGLPQPESIGYSMAKKMLIVQEEVYRKQHGLLSTVIIPSNIYGKYDNFSLTDSHVIPALVRKFYETSRGISEQVVIWGNGSASRDFIDAVDVSIAIIKCFEQKAAGVFNVGYGQQHTISEIAQMLSKVSGVSAIAYDDQMPSGQKSREFSTEKFSRLFPDFKVRDISAGLQETYDWLNNNYEAGKVRL